MADLARKNDDSEDAENDESFKELLQVQFEIKNIEKP